MERGTGKYHLTEVKRDCGTSLPVAGKGMGRGTGKADATTGFSAEVYRHFGLDLSEMRDKGEEHDWGICKREDADKCTGNMAGFGMGQSQRIIIDYDKGYDWVLVRRIKCGTVRNAPHMG